MSRHSRRPRRTVRAEPIPPSLHYRDPETNERSVCDAEVKALPGEVIVSTLDPLSVTCDYCKRSPEWIAAAK